MRTPISMPNRAPFVGLLVLVLCFVVQHSAQAGAAHEKSLLWRIHSTGVSHDSYLYGTFHLRDERVYRFSDSVLASLATCRTFALEQRMDTLVSRMVRDMFDTTQGLRLGEVLHGAELDSVTQLVVASLAIPEAMVPNLRCGLVMQLIGAHESGTSRRATFLDAYLLGLARALHKDLRALEPYEHTMDLMDQIGRVSLRLMFDSTASGAEQSLLEPYIKLYQDQNIDSLTGSFAMMGESGLVDSILALRNVVMAASIDSLHRHASVFAAMGAAHLGGSNGIIELLRAKGYSVSPVAATYTGRRHDYDTVDITQGAQWYDFHSEHNGFSLKMPAPLAEAPMYKKMYENLEMDLPQCSDIISGLQFIAIAVRTTGQQTAEQKAAIATRMANAYFDDPDSMLMSAEQGGSDSYLNNACFDYVGESKYSSQMRLRVVVTKSGAYTLLVMGTKENIHSSMVNTYLNSLTFEHRPREPWTPYVDSTARVSVDFIGHPLTVNRGEKGAAVMVAYATDLESGNTFTLQHNWLGNKVEGVSLKAMVRSMLSSDELQEAIGSSLVFDTVSRSHLSCHYSTKADSTGARRIGRIVIHRRTIYLFEFSSSDPAKEAADSAHFFSSIRFLPDVDSALWRDYTNEEWHLSASLPGEVDESSFGDEDGSSPLLHSTYIQANDPVANQRVSITMNRLSPYTCFDSPDSLCQYWIRRVRIPGDSLGEINHVFLDNSDVYDVTLFRSRCDIATRYRIIIRGSVLCVAGVYLHHDFWDRSEIRDFFRSIVLPAPDNFNLRSSKLAHWQHDLLSADDDTSSVAAKACEWMDFSEADVTTLKTLLLRKSLPLDAQMEEQSVHQTQSDVNSVRLLILERLLRSPDSLTPAFLRQLDQATASLCVFRHYAQFAIADADKPELQAWALRALTVKENAKSSCGGPSKKDILRQCNSHSKALVQNLSLLEALYPQAELRTTVLRSLRLLLDSSAISLRDLHITEAVLVRDIQRCVSDRLKMLEPPARKKGNKPQLSFDDSDLEQRMNDNDDECYALNSVLRKMPYSAQSETALRNAMKQYHERDLDLWSTFAISLLQQGRTVEPELLLQLLNTPYAALRTLHLLDSSAQRKALPDSLFSQRNAALRQIIESATGDHFVVDSSVYLRSVATNFDGKKGRSYVFKLRLHRTNSDDDSMTAWRVALQGQYPDDTSNLNAQVTVLEVSDKNLDELSIDDHIKACLDSYAKETNPPVEDDEP